ncbi:ROK family transcriptional regulator [Microlunatus soli]|uniref:Sugar kinase of the NBD/HSP70 family, may contain an N-terminal HTH domain n=1 Tax=Microlunatus soli TaxID=630515 RepID=A0A1H1QME5_9ACTN|nr:ROK family transcriptional regulator [Microlunatus soli]SDS24575.1 Sugar kinase of the NBD/HSP70 family, may contain an N-terminal HTH domain [Microlunatus soli]
MLERGFGAAGPVPRTGARLADVLVDSGPTHRAELARTLGLSRTRISSVVAELVGRGILTELDGAANDAIDGRAGPRVALSDRLGVVAGVQIITTHTSVVVQTVAGELLAERQQDRPLDPGTGEERFTIAGRLVEDCLAEVGSPPLAAVGVGAFGQIDPDTGVVSTRPNGLWWGVDLRELSRRTFAVPTVLQNNTRLEAMAEASWGAGKGLSPVLSIGLGRGLTANTVVDGIPMIGAHGGGGELGHTTIDIHGELCSCGGRGCLWMSASATAIVNRLRNTIGSDWEGIIGAAAEGNPAAIHAFLDAADVLGISIASLANIIDPAVIVVGGDMLRSTPRFLERIITQVHDHSPTAARQAQIVPATFGGTGRGGSLAAALLARRLAVSSLDLGG